MRAARNILEDQQPLLFVENRTKHHRSSASLLDELTSFREFQTTTEVKSLGEGKDAVPVFINEFWTSKQRAASSLHRRKVYRHAKDRGSKAVVAERLPKSLALAQHLHTAFGSWK